MGDLKASRFPDNEFIAGLVPIREATADIFSLVLENADPTRGWNVQRFVEWGRIDEALDERSYRRDKEYSFRPKFAPLAIDQINYREFDNPKPPPPDPSLWRFTSTKVGFEVSTVSDFFGIQKDEIALQAIPAPGSTPTGGGEGERGWNPSHMNSLNRSGLVISRQPLEDGDRDFDLPDRYFGRTVDIMVPWATQKIKLQRIRFDPPGEGDGSQEDINFFKSTPRKEEYDEGVWKTTWNVTVDDNPIRDELRKLNEHEGGPDIHGFRAHRYIPGLPVTPDEDVARASDLSGSTKRGDLAQYFEGGWLYDGVQDVLAQASDLFLLIPRSDIAQLPRYRNRFDQPIGLAVMRHDVHFTKRVDEDPPAPNVDDKHMSGRIFFTVPFQ